MRSRLPLVLALCVIVLIVLISVRGSHHVVISPRDSGSFATRGNDLLEDPGAVEERRGATQSSAATLDVPSAATATGRLHLRVIDATTHEPVAGVECLVYSERGGNKLHATCVTDREGRAEAAQLPANTILVEARRKPPHAAGFAGVWLDAGESKDVEIALGAGGTLKGRVVDDAEAPVEGAELLLSGDVSNNFLPHEDISLATRIATRTGADGRFVLEHVVSPPFEVWIVDGAMRPEHFGAVTAMVRLGDRLTFTFAQVKPGQTVDVGDVELRRSSFLRGHVVDARGAPIEGALVSANPQRASARGGGFGRQPDARDRWPGLEGFRMYPGESESAADGSFQVSNFQSTPDLVVWTRAGTLERFPAPRLEPGSARDGLELRMKDASLLEIELVDANGKRIDRANQRFAALNPTLFNGRSSRGLDDRARITLALGQGEEERRTIGADADALFRLQRAPSFEGLQRVRIDLDGYRTAIEDVVAAPSNGDRLRFQLRETAVIRAHVSIADQAESLASEHTKPKLFLHACTLDPARRGDIKTARRTGNWQLPCCGLGAQVYVPLEAADLHIEIPVGAEKPFWIQAWTAFAVNDWHAVFGPFTPGASTAEIVVPTIEPSMWRAVQDMFADSGPPAPKQPGEGEEVGTVEARIVDAHSGSPVAHARLDLEQEHRRSGISFSRNAESNQAGRARDTRVGTGRWRAHVEAEHYSNSREIQFTVEAGAKIDLGTIALERSPETTITLLESDGSPVPRDTKVSIFDADMLHAIASSAYVDSDDGRAAINGLLGARFVVEADEPDMDANEPHEGFRDRGMRERPVRQRVLVDRPGDDPLIVRLAPWRQIEIRVVGPAAEPPFLSLGVSLQSGPLQDSSLPSLLLVPQELGIPSPTARRFVARGAAGRYRVRGESPLFHLEETSIEVKDVAGTQSFELSSMP